MTDLTGTRTRENLIAAFAADAQASRRFQWMAQAADVDGRPDVASTLRAIADSDAGHANGHLDHLAESGDPATGTPIGSIEENLRSAIASETYECTQMYPGFARQARADGLSDIADWFDALAVAGQRHVDRLTQILDGGD
ncbi:MAG: rubrerythrin family protein [Actinomycetota bacterium]